MTGPHEGPVPQGMVAWRARRTRLAQWAPLFTLVALLAVFLALSLRLIDVGTGDLGIVGLFSTDEKLAGQLVRAMLQNRNLGLSHFFSYGPIDLYAARALLAPYGLFRPVTDEAIIVALRLVSLASGIGCVCVTYVLGRRLWNAWSGATAAAILLAGSTFFAWSTTAHPDMLQLLWLLLGLWVATVLTERSSVRLFGTTAPVSSGAALAGLAFATKYSGELILPILWLADGLGRWRTINETPSRTWHSQLGPFALDIGVSIVTFLAVFIALDPSAVREWRSFLYQMTLEAGLAHGGHLLQASLDPAGWLRLLASDEVLGLIGLIVALTALAAWTLFNLRALLLRRLLDTQARQMPLVIFTAGYLVFLLVWIGDRQARYALPAMPGLALVAGAGAAWVAERSRLWTLLALAVLLLALQPLAARLLAYEQVQVSRMRAPGVRDRIEAGQWLSAHVTTDTLILADAYSYLPPAFPNTEESFGLTRGRIESDRPGVIVTDSSIRDRFLDPGLAGHYVDGSAVYQEIGATYQALESGSLPCYRLVQRFGPVAIYGRLGVDFCTAGTLTSG